ncbi:MAG: AraC family transcriptional activator of pobA [Parvicellaceae bacterium]|jgi:AraC family transcriptional activator of pobA
MNTVKTYQKVNSEKENVSFRISKMEDIFIKRDGAVDEPHRHDFFTVLIINKAKGIHKIDFNTYVLSSNQIYFVAPGQVHQLIEEEASMGYVMTFSTQFLIENSIQLSFIESLNLFHDYGQSPPLIANDRQHLKLKNYADEILNLFNSTSKMKELSMGAFLKLFLIECNNLCSINPLESNFDTSDNHIISKFKKRVNESYKLEHLISYYADQLHITSDHLNRTIKSTIGKTAKEYIQSRIITEAKRLLYFSKLSNKEIGFALGFSEPANFSAFFKNCTGFSPSNFQKKEVLLLK